MSFKKAIATIQKHYPLRYAESAWDNTGLLVDSNTPNCDNILLTIDLTKSVIDEAIKKKINLIIAYHPFIFKGIKQINPKNNPQHDTLIKLIQNGISVYSPHTAIDAAYGGVNDWLCQGLTSSDNIKSKSVIDPNDEDPSRVGMGRLVELTNSIELSDIINNVKTHLGVDNLLVASNNLTTKINSIAVCAGSGSGVFSKLKSQPDLYLTGELSHHEALFLKEKGANIIAANHSNTERGFLKVLKDQLSNDLDAKVFISESDSDPFKFV